MSIIQGGSVANGSGKMLEDSIRDVIVRNGYTELTVDEKALLVNTGEIHRFAYPRWFVAQAPMYKNVYGARFQADFILLNDTTYPDGLVIESKFQKAPGSVDEKYVFTVMTLKGVKPMPSMLVLDGGGARRKAIEWIQSENNKLFSSKSLIEFTHWAITEL